MLRLRQLVLASRDLPAEGACDTGAVAAVLALPGTDRRSAVVAGVTLDVVPLEEEW